MSGARFGPGCSPQQARGVRARRRLPSASSKVTITSPWSLYAGECRIFGTHFWRNTLALTSPPGLPSTHGESCPSLQRFGVMNE